MQSCRNCRLTGGTAALLPEQKKSPAVFLTALLLTLFLSDNAQEHGGAISTDITSCRSPTLLQQLASFAALREVAEEEQLDWGAPLVLGRQKRYSLFVQPEKKEEEEKGENENENESEEELMRGSDESKGDSVTGSSRRRPHRRQHRRKKTAIQQGSNNNDNNNHNDNKDVICNDDPIYKDDSMRSHRTTSGSSNGVSSGESNAGSLESAETPRGSLIHTNTNNTNTTNTIANASPVASLPLRVWSQLHVMDIALSTHDNNFMHITQRFVQYEAMYPIIYRCDLHQLTAPHEEELLAAPTTGLQTSRFWSCRSCGKAHDVVRETCVRCKRHTGPFTKLFFGQTIKEKADCVRSVLRLLYATHPGITIHRIEVHQNENGRGRGCASVYVSADAASELISKLNGNVFFDTNHTSPSLRGHHHYDDDDDDGMNGLYVHYVYSSQRPWLEALIAVRTSQRHHVNIMPLGALVVEDSKENTHNTGELTTITRTKAARKKSGGKISKTTIHTSRSSPTDL